MSNEVEGWVKRFRVLDAQEEEVIDDSAHYRSLLGRGSEEPARRTTAQAEQPRPKSTHASRASR